MDDYTKSKNEIVSQMQAEFDENKKRAKECKWEWNPKDTIYDLKSLSIKSVKQIKTFAPLKEYKNLKSIVFEESTTPDLHGLDEAKQISYLQLGPHYGKNKIKKNIQLISKLSNLTILGLGQVTHELPANLVEPLDKLTYLRLSKYNYKSIGRLPKNLVEINLYFNDISTLPAWNTVTTVKRISLGRTFCKPLETLSSFGCFPNLESIEIWAPKLLYDISIVKKLKHLKSIEVNFSLIENLNDFSGHQTIEEIKARKTKVSNLDGLQEMPKLKNLYLEKSKLSSIDGISKVFPALELLWLFGSKVKDLSPLQGMSTIKELSVSAMKPKSWDFISSLTGLETLDIYKSSFSDISLLSDLPNLKYVRHFESRVDVDTEEYQTFKKKILSKGGKVVDTDEIYRYVSYE